MLTHYLTAFDTETTGIDVETDRIVSAAIVTIRTDTLEVFDSATFLLNPGIEIPQAATAVHGITTARAQAEGIPAREGILRIVAALADRLMNDDDEPTGAPLVVYNAPFDLTLLDREFRRHMAVGLEENITPRGSTVAAPWWGPDLIPVIDPLVIDRHVDRYRKGSRKLSDVAALFGVEALDAHNAEGDAIAAARIATLMLKSERLFGATLASLHEGQARWSAESAETLAAYYQGRGDLDRAAAVNGEWPTRQYTGKG